MSSTGVAAIIPSRQGSQNYEISKPTGGSNMMRYQSIALTLITLSVCRAQATPIPSSTTERGTLQRGGDDFFPFGIHHVSWIENRRYKILIPTASKTKASPLSIGLRMSAD